MSGTRAARAYSAARVTFSPTTAPIEPPMNPKSMTQIATGGRRSRRCPRPRRRACRSPPARPRCDRGTSSGPRTRARRPTGARRPAPRTSPGPAAARAGRGRQPEVVAAGRADPHRLLELLVEQHRRAGRALGPEVGRIDVAARAERGQLERHQASLRPGDGADGAGHRVARRADAPPGDVGRAGEREGRRRQGAADERPAGRRRAGGPSRAPRVGRGARQRR